MALHQLADVAHYLRYLRENPAEADLLFKEVLIGVTTFFRDAEVWGFIKTRLFAELISAIPNNTVLRAWVPACSTGEEAYSLGICFREALRESGTSKQIALQIFATDLDKAAVEKARQATYPASIASQVAPELLERYFSSEGEHRYRVRQEVRELVVFATQNVLQDPPFTKLDLLSCRNLLIYLTAETQRKVLPLFHYSLKPGGALVLGSAETIGGFHELFRPRDGALRIYRRLETSAGMSPIDFPTHRLRPPGQGKEPMTVTTPAGPDANQPNLQAQVEAILVRRFSPAAVLVGRAGDILFVSGRTNSYLEVPAGKTNWNLLAMAREGLRQAFEGVLERVAQSGRAMALKGVEVGSDGGARTVDVTIEPLDEPRGLRGTLLVVFNEVAPPPAPTRSGRPAGARGEQVARLEKQLSRATSELRATRDEAQTAQEELKSANEELQSTNEELQSANEELTTSKEEIQSMNEELQTLNAELQAKVDDLSRTSNDMRNLLDSTAIAVLFLDEALSVRRFTPQAATLIKLIAGDIGRPLADLATTLEYPALYDDAREVLRTLAFKETTVRTHDGQKVGVRIMPYRTSENRIDGVVITFVSMPGGALPVTPKRSESR